MLQQNKTYSSPHFLQVFENFPTSYQHQLILPRNKKFTVIAQETENIYLVLTSTNEKPVYLRWLGIEPGQCWKFIKSHTYQTLFQNGLIASQLFNNDFFFILKYSTVHDWPLTHKFLVLAKNGHVYDMSVAENKYCVFEKNFQRVS
jgi:hypothetical protein